MSDACETAICSFTGTPHISDDFSGQFFRIFEIITFCLFVAISVLVHTVEATYGLP